MYMRNSGQNKYAKYNIDDFPPNYSGLYTKDSLREEDMENRDENFKPPEHLHAFGKQPDIGRGIDDPPEKKEPEEPKEKRDGSLLGNLFGGNKDGRKGGILSGLFNKGDHKDGGLLSHIELEDLILLAVIFFLLKDGFEDDLIIILAIILFSS